MSSLEHFESRAGDAVREHFGVLQRRDVVVPPGAHQGRLCDRRQIGENVVPGASSELTLQSGELSAPPVNAEGRCRSH